MDSETTAPLERSVSEQSTTSMKSYRSVRKSRKLTSYPSSSASSIATSEDKSLTSFPSFSPESPRQHRSATPEAFDGATLSSKNATDSPPAAPSIVESLTTSSPQAATARSALFDDHPVVPKIPGALHHASDEHIERLITRHGAVGLVRSIAEDVAHRDVQIASMRRRAEERERALRKIILECGLSNLDLETRLRTIEQEAKTNVQARQVSDGGLSDLITDAMADNTYSCRHKPNEPSDATIRASSLSVSTKDAQEAKGTTRGWKDYLWGTTSKKSSRSSSLNGDANRSTTVIKAPSMGDRRPTLSEDLFNPPDELPPRSASRASSVQSVQPGRKPSSSFATLALRLVAGGATTARENEARGRASSSVTGGSLRTASTSSARTSQSVRAVSTQGGPRALMAMRRAAGNQNAPTAATTRAPAQERWDVASSPQSLTAARQDNYGPVEMDTILPAESQPPTLTHIYQNYVGADYLTDRFGFIYDQRRKKRQREAAQVARHVKKGSRTEMLSNGRFSPIAFNDDGSSVNVDAGGDSRPESPSSLEEPRDEGKPKRWQDYLKIATFPTELLSHTPSISIPALEVMEGGEAAAEASEEPETSRPAGGIKPENRGFMPSATTTTAVGSEPVPSMDTDQPAAQLAKDDAEPVKLLLQRLNDVHDSIQREKTPRWNDFLRKVRAERKREEVASAAAAAATSTPAESRLLNAAVSMPEAKLVDGEIIGVAGLGNKGKTGRAKWNEFKNLVLCGIPVSLRPKIWSECTGASDLKVPGYYDDLVSRKSAEDDPSVVSQIQMDIYRTLTDNVFFRNGTGVSRLNEVLLAYSRRNPEVGYCQGMNLIAGYLLIVMPTAEEAFWVLASIVENILPGGYYDKELLTSRADQQVLRGYVTQVLPRLSAHLEELGIELEALTFQWFLSIFTDCLSAEALFRVWDVVLCLHDGATFLFQVALALLKLNEPQLLRCATPATVYTYINHQMTNHAISIDGLIQASEGLRKLVRREDVEARRDKALEAEKELTKQREERDALRRSRKTSSAAMAAARAMEGQDVGAAEGAEDAKDAGDDGEVDESTAEEAAAAAAPEEGDVVRDAAEGADEEATPTP